MSSKPTHLEREMGGAGRRFLCVRRDDARRVVATPHVVRHASPAPDNKAGIIFSKLTAAALTLAVIAIPYAVKPGPVRRALKFAPAAINCSCFCGCAAIAKATGYR